MFAIIETGGKQYLVSPKSKISTEKLPPAQGGEVIFEKVLLVSDDKGSLRIGKPYLEGIRVLGKVLRQGRLRKLKILKYRAKSRYRRHIGHRQEFTEVQINRIG